MNIQDSMFSDIRDRELFEKAKSYAMEYVEGVFESSVFPSDQALADLSIFEETMPDHSGDADQILDLLNTYGSPATIPQIGGRYYGLVNGGVVPAALAVKYLTDFWDQNSPLYATSPIASKLETVVERWLIDLLNLPTSSVAGFVSGTSMSILCGLAAARWRIYQRLNFDVNSHGLVDAPKIRVVAGKEAHGTVFKAVALLGLGTGNIELVDVDSQGRINPEKMPELDDRTIVILQAGNVNSGSFDDFETICAKANEANSWVHIDGAFGLWAAATKDLKHLTKGVEKANSWSMDGHKTLNTPYDNGIILCKDKEALVAALQATGAYIVYGKHRDGMLYTPEMSRRARIVELWATMKYLGRDGMNEMICGLHARAQQFANQISMIEGFKVLNDVVFNQVIVCCDSDEITNNTISEIQDLRECWVGGSTWSGKAVIRVSVCSWATTEKDIDRSVSSFEQALLNVTR